MKVLDQELWSVQLAELDNDETSRKFRDFFLLWMETADTLLESEIPVRDALATAFISTEKSLGFLSVDWVGQMFLLMTQHWDHGHEAWELMSVWERRMVEQAFAMKIAELQESSKMGGVYPKSGGD